MPGLDDLIIGDGVKVVSFDIFDTLIVRPYIRPKDLFAHMEQAEGAPGFAAERVDAERRSRRSVGADGSRETTFDAIYEEIAPQYRHLKEAELRYKSNVLRYRPVADLFDRLVAEGREVVLISDMYLPSERIAAMLESCGIRGYGRLYVSCEHGVNKRHGGLFRKVLDDLGLRPEELHHIGDNAHSDHRVPKGMGIRATCVPSLAESYFGAHPRAARFHRRDRSLSASVIAAVDAIRWMDHGDDLSWREVAYRFGGPAVCGYCAFVHDSGDRPLAFVARDGYNLIRTYRVLFGDSRRSTYVYAPRIAYILAGRDYASYRNHKAILADRLFPECAEMDDGERERFFDDHLQEAEARRASVAAGIRARMNEAAGGGDLTVVDVTTLKYTSQRLVSEMLPDRDVDGVYYFVLDDSSPLPHRGYCVRGVFPQPGSNINLTEFFMTAPEPPVRSIDDSGMPVYEEVSEQERRRLGIYDGITDGEVSYAEDMKRLYGGSIPRLEYGTVSRWLRVLTGDRLCRPMLADMGWPVDPANRVYVSMVLHPRDSLYYLKKAVLDMGSALLRLVRR